MATGTRNDPGHWFEAQPLWFKTAVFYEIHTRAFFDANGDGSGDFRGLTEKLDYLQWLGVDCIWLLPFFKSPLRDGGYDIADFFRSSPTTARSTTSATSSRPPTSAGSRDRGPRHEPHVERPPWFQEAGPARTAPARLVRLVDTTDRYTDARIIFTDTEVSNWTWDEQARPTLAPLLQPPAGPQLRQPRGPGRDAQVLRFWLDLGMDGFRLDAVPYLYERDGTNGENLPETHAYLKRVCAEVDANYPDRVLLAEANQWPADVVEYFGDGDECHMAFHFPVMPRMFMAVRREEANPSTRSCARRRYPGQLPVGPVPAQPRRADAQDGHRRGTRLHVRGVRQGPADEDQRGHPPPAAPLLERAATRSSCCTRSCSASPARRSSTTATRS